MNRLQTTAIIYLKEFDWSKPRGKKHSMSFYKDNRRATVFQHSIKFYKNNKYEGSCLITDVLTEYKKIFIYYIEN